jgi:hypothetical protein
MLDRILVMLVLAVPTALIFAWASFGYPTEGEICEITNGTKNCESYNIFFAATWNFLKAIDHWSVLITALATGAIAYFTFTIRNINRSQLIHAHRVERAYVSGGGVPERRPARAWIDKGDGRLVQATEPTGRFELHVNNYGKTPGELLEIGFGWCEAGNIPERPEYEWIPHQDWAAPGVGSRHIKTLAAPKTTLSRPAIYGRFRYRDIFGAPHSDGFIQEGAIPILAPRRYTESDPEWDLPEVGKRKHEKDSDN